MIAVIPADFPEDAALSVVGLLAIRYGWATSIFTRADAEGEWQTQAEVAAALEGGDPAPFDAAAWDRVQTSFWWRKVLGDADEADWSAISEAVNEAMQGG